MTDAMRSLACVFITLFLGFALKELGFKGSRLVVMICIVGVIGVAAIMVGRIIDSIPGIDESMSEYAVAMLKIIGVGYLFGVCSDICTELGESGLSGAVCLLGRVEIITLTLPYIKRIIEAGSELI